MVGRCDTVSFTGVLSFLESAMLLVTQCQLSQIPSAVKHRKEHWRNGVVRRWLRCSIALFFAPFRNDSIPMTCGYRKYQWIATAKGARTTPHLLARKWKKKKRHWQQAPLVCEERQRYEEGTARAGRKEGRNETKSHTRGHPGTTTTRVFVVQTGGLFSTRKNGHRRERATGRAQGTKKGNFIVQQGHGCSDKTAHTHRERERERRTRKAKL